MSCQPQYIQNLNFHRLKYDATHSVFDETFKKTDDAQDGSASDLEWAHCTSFSEISYICMRDHVTRRKKQFYAKSGLLGYFVGMYMVPS